mgnify:CR=1 FL=1
MEGFGLFQEEPSGLLLLISCSSKKRKTPGLLPARLRYSGVLLQLALQFADVWRLEPIILSAKYGFINPEQKIEYYDQKLKMVYDGPYPTGKGFFVGSDLYFGKAPKRYCRLIPRLSIGKQLAFMKQLIQKGPP